MVEYTIDTMEKKSTKRILSYIRKTTYERLKKEHVVDVYKRQPVMSERYPFQQNGQVQGLENQKTYV